MMTPGSGSPRFELRISGPAIERMDLLEALTEREQWQLIEPDHPRSGSAKTRVPWRISTGRCGTKNWEAAVLSAISPIWTAARSRLITTRYTAAFMCRFGKIKYMAPCEATCPTGIPVQERWKLVRDGRVDEAVDLALAFTPFPASVCGYLCPHPCMTACTKGLGLHGAGGRIPAGPGQHRSGASRAAAPFRQTHGRYRRRSRRHLHWLGSCAKGTRRWSTIPRRRWAARSPSVIPSSRIPDVVEKGSGRAAKVIPHVHLQQHLNRSDTEQLITDYDFVLSPPAPAKAKNPADPGKRKLITAMDFLEAAKAGAAETGKRVVIIGAGNVGCDVATEAARLGAEEITLLDVQEPAVSARSAKMPRRSVPNSAGRCLPRPSPIRCGAGDRRIDSGRHGGGLHRRCPDLGISAWGRGHRTGLRLVNEDYQTSNPKVFAIGDVVRPGLLTDAIGAGRRAAETIAAIAAGKRPGRPQDGHRHQPYRLEYWTRASFSMKTWGSAVPNVPPADNCRDCGICVACARRRPSAGRPSMAAVTNMWLTLIAASAADFAPVPAPAVSGTWCENPPLGNDR
jgi:hypothetical protein